MLMRSFLLGAGLLFAMTVMCVGQNSQPMYRFNAQPPWLHGFHSYRSPFAGHTTFRPSNYRQAAARAQFMTGYTPGFWANYSYRPLPADMTKLGQSLAAAQPLMEVTDPPMLVSDGSMSPIRSIRVAEPEALPISQVRKTPVIRAVDRQETGPLFPLPMPR